MHQLLRICEGDFVDRSENLLIFGLPGRGKTHFAAVVGHELIQRGRSVLFTAYTFFDDEGGCVQNFGGIRVVFLRSSLPQCLGDCFAEKTGSQ